MTLLNADSQSRFLIGARRAVTGQPGAGRGRLPWTAFLIALLQAMSVGTA
jgi:hypothetical protein